MLQQKYIDLQVNGYSGVDFSSPDLQIEDVLATAKKLKSKGTLIFCPTIITSPGNIYERNLPILAKAMNLAQGVERYAQIAGIHIEGPFISPKDGARGVHSKNHITLPSISEFEKLYELSKGQIIILTLAPEIDGGLELIEHAVSQGVNVSIGHTLADHITIDAAAKSGARFSTHLGNGIPATIHRHQNPIWSQLAHPLLTPMIIADGHHLPLELIQVILAVKGDGNVIVVSDASPAAGLPPGEYEFFGTKTRLEIGGKLLDPDTGYLAGSSATMNECAAWLKNRGFKDETVSAITYANALRLVERL